MADTRLLIPHASSAGPSIAHTRAVALHFNRPCLAHTTQTPLQSLLVVAALLHPSRAIQSCELCAQFGPVEVAS
eukprot:2194200-Rhodomonas_salina.2